MHINRLLAAALTTTLAACLVAAATPAATATGSSTPTCPMTGFNSTDVFREDFAPEPMPGWYYEPAESWAPGGGGASSYLHGAIPAAAGADSAAIMPSVTLPAHKASVLWLEHKYEFVSAGETPVLGHLQVGTDGSFTELAEFTGSFNGGGTHARYDLSGYAGQPIQLRFQITGGNAEAPATAGWYLHDITITACNIPPGVPQSVTATGGIDKATVRWESPASPGTGAIQKYTVTVTPGDRVVEVGPDARSTVINGLTINPSYQYSFAVRAHNATGASPAAVKSLTHTRVYPSVPKVITYGSYVMIGGYVARADGTPLGAGSVKLHQRKTGTTSWSYVTTAKIHSNGHYGFMRKPSRNMDYRVVYPGSSKYFGAISATRTVKVKPIVSGSWSDSTIRVGQSSVFRGSVKPNHAGRRIYLQLYYDGQWHSDYEFSRKLTSESAYRIPVQFLRKGTYYWRAYLPAHGDHTTAASPKRKIVVS